MSFPAASSNGAPNPAFDSMNRKQDHSDGLGQSQSSKNELKGKKGKKLKKKLRKCEKQLQKAKKAAKKSKHQYEANQKSTDALIRNVQLTEQLKCSDIIMECCNPEIAKKYIGLRDSQIGERSR